MHLGTVAWPAAAAASGLLAVLLLLWVARLKVQLARRPYSEVDLDLARRTSVAASRTVTSGKVQEHLAPLLRPFADRFNLREARFLGAPVDYVVFEGLEDGEIDQVTFVEIKTGTAGLSVRERRIRDAVLDGRVGFETITLSAPSTVVRDGDRPRSRS